MTTLDRIKAEIEQIAPYDLPWDKRTPEHIRDMALEIIEKYEEQEPTKEEQALLQKWRDNRGVSMEEFSEALDALQEPQEGGANNG